MMVNWDSARKQAYEKARERELDELNELKREKAESEAIGAAKEKLNILVGFKDAVEAKLTHEVIKICFPSFNESDLYKMETYVTEHKDCSVEDLAQEIGLIGHNAGHSGVMDSTI